MATRTDRSAVRRGEAEEACLTPYIDQFDRMARTAVEIATMNTLLFWGQAKNDRWVKLGTDIVHRLELDTEGTGSA